jgi:uncharacterized LabA/DUF88 family protein
MSENGEVALFVDFENIRYGLKNNYGREPDPTMLMAKARKYGPVALALAYADFNEHPDFFRRKLEVAGITPRDVARRSPDVVNKSSSDMAMLIDIIDCLLDRPSVMTLILMTGDSDFIRAVARARHRFGKKVIISGVTGSVSNDLIAASDGADPLTEADWGPPSTPEPVMHSTYRSDNGSIAEPMRAYVPAPFDQTPIATEPLSDGSTPLSHIERELVKLLDYLDRNRPYLTFIFVKTHALSSTQLNLSPMQVDQIFTQFKERGILRDEVREQEGRTMRLLYFIREHPAVQSVLQPSPRPTL